MARRARGDWVPSTMFFASITFFSGLYGGMTVIQWLHVHSLTDLDQGGPPLLVRQPLLAKESTEKAAKLPTNQPKSMWEMTAKDQRQFLQDMHADEAMPSGRAAAQFAAYARRQTPALPLVEDEATIFVVTASYRDPEVASTIARAYARAARPYRIRIGVHAQNAAGDAEPERDPIGGLAALNVTCPRHPVCRAVAEGRIRVSRELWKRAEGPTVARAIAERHYRNETYVMGVDSHCQFAHGWDEVAINMFERIGNDHAIITAYPESYSQTYQGGDGTDDRYVLQISPSHIGCITRTRRVNVHNTCSWKHEFGSCPVPTAGPVRVAFFAAGFSFSRGHRVLRVPYDFHTPYIFDGEEISMGIRAWTWGYDMYLMDRNIISHLYIPNGSPLRPVFWTTDWGKRWPCQFRSLLRIHRQLHVHPLLSPSADPATLDLEEWDKYNVGPRRDPLLFFKWARVAVVNEWGEKCKPPPNAPSTAKPGKQHCLSADLHDEYFKRPGGMPYVPWKAGTEQLFPQMRRSQTYPPPADQWFV